MIMNLPGQNSPVSPPASGASAADPRTAGQVEPTVRVWLVDDNHQFRALVAETLGRLHGIECARQFASPDELLSALASKLGPDVILLDIEMHGQNGIDAIRPIKSLNRSTRVLMYTTFYDPVYFQRALEDGASDYLLKTDPLEKVVQCIRHGGSSAPARLRVKHSTESKPEAIPVKLAVTKPGCDRPRPLARTLQMLRSLWN